MSNNAETPATSDVPAAPPVWAPAEERKPTRQRLDTTRACSMLLARYVRKWMDGKVRIDDVSKLAHILQVQARLIEGRDFEARIEALEEAAKSRLSARRVA